MSEQVDDAPIDRGGYDFNAMQAKWRPVWEKLDPFKAKDDGSAERRYALTMFSYPSGDLHMGHAEVFALHDLLARYWFQQGYDVLNPVGWDSFGLPAENAAIKRNEHPATYTYANIETQAESIRRYGMSFDWSRRLHTSDPEYYRWTQWLFLRLYERGLAYRKASYVNWCPHDQTVLANEQVVQGRCERCGHEVTKRELTQWYFKTTDYAQRLLDDMDLLQWPEEILLMQRNWIGRSEGAFASFQVEGRDEPIKVFTTRPDTLFGATFMVVAPDAKLAAELVTPDQQAAFDEYLTAVKATTEIERLSTERDKTGVFLGSYAVNPVTGQRIPIWAADYVLAEYGTGAIMAVPGQDTRDWEFAEKFGLPIVRTVQPEEGFDGKAYTGEGPAINSANDEISLDGLGVDEAKARIIDWLDRTGRGERTINYRLRDWLLSRQRYWGCPIPIIHCPSCGEVPVPDDQLPMELPDLRGADLQPKGVSPLAADREWVEVDCPKCGGKAERDTDTMDTFVDSSWYFLRYLSPEFTEGPFDPVTAENWMSVYQYVGGKEHAVLHLLYARFFVKALHDMGLLTAVEPFTRLLNQGQVINQGKSMSKSLGNGVNLGDQIDAFGVDAVRLTMVFAGPPADDIDWADMSPGGALKFLQRAWRLAGSVEAPVGADPSTGDVALRKLTHRTVSDAAELIDSFRFNVMVARMMELVNATRKAIDAGPGAADPAVREAVETVAILLSLVAPYTAEEMWEELGHEPTVAKTGWPKVDPALLVQDAVTCVVQIAGKVKDRLEVSPDISDADLEQLALASEAVQKALDGRGTRKVIVRAPKLVNIVPA
ncbi:leucine--tRNA ligase [Kribbella sp. NPDC051952]|uniref:leucine--tRNA ligase n=1 Tax=Kribbella sp. NPDC051952 TaxID=3154851 RepID=UPI003417AFCC